ncbi:STAS domain-containing protein [Streptomyces sp. NPDC055109]
MHLDQRDRGTPPRKAPAGPVVEVTGDLDYAAVPGFRETVIGLPLAPGQLLTLVLAGLAYCDSTGLTVLVAAHGLVIERRGPSRRARGRTLRATPSPRPSRGMARLGSS